MDPTINAKVTVYIDQNPEICSGKSMQEVVSLMMATEGTFTPAEIQNIQNSPLFKNPDLAPANDAFVATGSEVVEDVSVENDPNVKKFTDNSGREITQVFDGETLLEQTIRSEDDSGNVTELHVVYQNGKPKQTTKKVNGNTMETSTYTYNDATEDASESVTIETVKANRTKVTTNVSSVNENGEFEEPNFISRVTSQPNGTETTVVISDGKLVESEKTFMGQSTTTIYNGSSLSEYDNGSMHRLAQTVEINGHSRTVEYDGNGNTKIVVQNGEVPAQIAQRFDVALTDLNAVNTQRGIRDNNGGFLAGASIVVPREVDANEDVLNGRVSSSVASAQFASDEQARVSQRIEGKEQKDVQVTKNYSSWSEFAKEQLISEGITNPTNQQIVDRTNELMELNKGIDVPQQGQTIKALKTEADISNDRSNFTMRSVVRIEGESREMMVRYYLSDKTPAEIEYFNRLSVEDQNRALNLRSSLGFDNTLAASDNTRVYNIEAPILRTEAQTEEMRQIQAIELEQVKNEPPESLQAKREFCAHLRQMYNEAKASFEYQRNVKDDVFADIADGVSHLWNNELFNSDGNSSTLVERDLENFLHTIEQLEASIETGGFERLYRDNFKITYKPEALEQYEQNREKYQQVVGTIQASETVRTTVTSLLEEVNRAEEQYNKTTRFENGLPVKSGLSDSSIVNQAKFKFVSQVQQMLGLTREEITQISVQCIEKGIDSFELYKNMAQQLVAQADQAKELVLDGKSVEYYEREMDASRRLAYGNMQNIEERVTDYNISQDAGGAVTKGITAAVGTVVITAASGGTLTGLAVGTAVMSAGTEVASRATNGIEGDLQLEDCLSIGKKAIVDGAFVYVTGGIIGKTISGAVSSRTLSAVGGTHRFGGAVTTTIGKSTVGTLVDTAKELINNGGNISGQKLAIKTVVGLITGILTFGTLKNTSGITNAISTAGADGTNTWLAEAQANVIAQAQGEALEWINNNPNQFKMLILAHAQDQGIDVSTMPEAQELIAQQQNQNPANMGLLRPYTSS